MLHILFVPGTFGSTIQYILRAFSTTYTTDRLPNISYADMITADGSMHSFYKTGHYLKRTDLENLTEESIPKITTPIYPMLDYHADEVINFFKDNFPTDKYIFIYIDSIEYAEINMLAQYYKISNGVLNLSIEMFCGDNAHNIVNWNSSYKHWSEMQTWELREWLSIFYPSWVQEWIDAKQYADPSWLFVNSKDIINSPMETFQTILSYSGEIDYNLDATLTEFTFYWRNKQQYLLDEHTLIMKIVQTTIDNEHFSWNRLHIIAETIIQQNLRSKGYEIKCYNLNEFPTSSTELHNLLEKL